MSSEEQYHDPLEIVHLKKSLPSVVLPIFLHNRNLDHRYVFAVMVFEMPWARALPGVEMGIDPPHFSSSCF